MTFDNIMILLAMLGMGVVIALRIRRNRRFRDKLIRDFLDDPERKKRQGTE
jgi:hypothetical protein